MRNNFGCIKHNFFTLRTFLHLSSKERSKILYEYKYGLPITLNIDTSSIYYIAKCGSLRTLSYGKPKGGLMCMAGINSFY